MERFTNEDVINKVKALNKSYWFASDIKDYLNCSMKKANKIKNLVANKYGVIEENEDDEKQAVSADYVIKVIGGSSRIEELEILHKSMEILRKTR